MFEGALVFGGQALAELDKVGAAYGHGRLALGQASFNGRGEPGPVRQ